MLKHLFLCFLACPLKNNNLFHKNSFWVFIASNNPEGLFKNLLVRVQ